MAERLQGNPFAGLLGGGVPDELPVAAGVVVVHKAAGAAKRGKARRGTAGKAAKPGKTAQERAWQAAYRARNRERLAAYGRAYYERNREKLLAYGRAYRAQLGQLGRERLTPEQLAERERARLKAYYWRNREKVLAREAARRMAKKKAAAAAASAAQKGVGHV